LILGAVWFAERGFRRNLLTGTQEIGVYSSAIRAIVPNENEGQNEAIRKLEILLTSGQSLRLPRRQRAVQIWLYMAWKRSFPLSLEAYS